MNVKTKVKSSVTLMPTEIDEIHSLMEQVGATSKVEVIRKGLKLLRESVDRESMREQFKLAAEKVKNSTSQELEDLDDLSNEGLEEW